MDDKELVRLIGNLKVPDKSNDSDEELLFTSRFRHAVLFVCVSTYVAAQLLCSTCARAWKSNIIK
jgi:hypothetical protein